jgi:hypothetical protein
MRFRSQSMSRHEILAWALVLFASLTTSVYEFRTWSYGDLVGGVFGQHMLVLRGEAGNPVQYRALPEYLWDWLIRLQMARGSGDPIYTSLEVLRYSQNLLLFCLAYAYFRRLGLTVQTAMLGMAVFTLMLTSAVAPNWLRLSSNFDASFYLIAALLIFARRDWWIVPLSVVAALNREASGFIPFMLLTTRLPELSLRQSRNRVIIIVGTAVVVWLVVYAALRLFYPPQTLVTDIGWAAIQLNLGRETSWMNLFGTFGILPLVALLGYRWWPPLLKTWFWLIVPLWISVHVLYALINESLLFTEPTVLVLLPAALFAAVGYVPSPKGRGSIASE